MRPRIGPIALVLIVAGCGIGIGVPPTGRDPVPAGPLGPIIPDPEGDGPPAECRRVPREQCQVFGQFNDGERGAKLVDVERVIVTCEGVCSDEDGNVRIDLLLKSGQTVEAGAGGYGSEP